MLFRELTNIAEGVVLAVRDLGMALGSFVSLAIYIAVLLIIARLVIHFLIY